MIIISNVSVQFTGAYLFEDISFTIGKKDRIGLTGLNGTGKSTLLKAFIGDIKPDSGSITIPPKATLGYLPQIISVDYKRTVFDEAFTAFEDIVQLQNTIKEQEDLMGNFHDYESDDYAKLLNSYNENLVLFKSRDGHQASEKLERVMKGLGFMQTDFTRLVSEMSGGWQMRIELAKILLKAPDYILLDEPTNHLDIESIIWLEDFLKKYSGAVVMVSHDRAFLDNIINRTIEIDLGKIYDYKANYSKYLVMREERKTKQLSEFNNQQKYVEHTETLINKFRAKKNKAKFAQSLIKKLDRLELIEVDQTDIRKLNFQFQAPPRSGQTVVETKDLNKHYGDLQVLHNLNFIIERGEKIAFVGKNGEGKTTLSKIIAGKTDHTGTCKIGHNVSIGYFEQQQAETLDGNLTVLETIDNVATGEMRLKVRSLLGAFLFSGDDVDKKVKVLSGGEKGRLAMAKLMLAPYNLLILDEPTNHLDMRSKDILKNALNLFEGTIIVVSHDRDFLEGLSTKVFEFRNKKIKEHIGDIYDFLQARNISELNELELGKSKNTKADEDLDKAEKAALFAQRKADEKRAKSVKNKISNLEKSISEYEKKIKDLELQLADPVFYNDKPKSEAAIAQYNQHKKELDEKMLLWEKLVEELGALSF